MLTRIRCLFFSAFFGRLALVFLVMLLVRSMSACTDQTTSMPSSTRPSTSSSTSSSGGSSSGGTTRLSFVCWTSAERCDCKPNETVPSDGTSVTNCTTQQFDYCCQYDDRCGCDDNPGCGAGGREVTSCENRYLPQDPSACPRGGMVACDDSSTCPCGLTCHRTATSSTEQYCTETCVDDSDCSSSTKWKFSSLGCNPLMAVCIP